jgi:hypothetical protein
VVDIYPILYFFSAFAIICRKIFSALGVKVAACMRVMPNAFGQSGALVFSNMGLADKRGDDGDRGGVALRSFGELGRLDQLVRERLALDVLLVVLDKTEPTSLVNDDLLECLLSDFVKFVALLNRDLAGDVTTECAGETGIFGDCGDGGDGI